MCDALRQQARWTRSHTGEGQMAMPGDAASVYCEQVEGTATVAWIGEVDIATIGILRRVLLASIAAPVRQVVVDLADVSFLGACGVGALVAATTTAAGRGLRLSIWWASDPAAHSIRLTGASGLLEDPGELPVAPTPWSHRLLLTSTASVEDTVVTCSCGWTSDRLPHRRAWGDGTMHLATQASPTST